jgi:hypothetical protein
MFRFVASLQTDRLVTCRALIGRETQLLSRGCTARRPRGSFLKPDSIRFGSTVKQMETVLKSLCSTMKTRRIDPPFLDGIKDRQMQIDCEGFVFRNKPRHTEFVFGDDDLKMVWVMTDPKERVALEAAMRSAYVAILCDVSLKGGT